MKNYSIMPLMATRLKEICDDAERQYREGICTEVLFKMSLTPEGNPIIDKAKILTEEYLLFKNELDKREVPSGVLVQATIGHGYPMTTPIPFTAVVGALDGLKKYTACPYDKEFRQYIRQAMRTIAEAHPSSIMVDDDFRLFARKYKGCTCELHMQEISKRYGKKITREQLVLKMEEDDEEGKLLTDVFYETQIDSLIGAAKEMRAGMDEIDPRMQGSFCNCGYTCEGAGEISKILAGEGNPSICRVNNAKYCSVGARDVTRIISAAAMQYAILKKDVDIFLAETDTCPQNRYSTSASSLHTHFVCSILEGAGGAKHWITRLGAYEPRSGEAYRKKLSKFRGLYEKLSETVTQIEWFGARIPISDKVWAPTPPLSEYREINNENCWAGCVLERMGIPMYFSEKKGGAIFLDGQIDKLFSDEIIVEMLSGTAFIASGSAKRLQERGFGDLIGVTVTERNENDKHCNGEIIFASGESCNVQMQLKRLIPNKPETVARSMLYTVPDGKTKIPLYPGVTSYRNSLGGNIYVFSGTPKANFHYTEAFSFLNESRKKQLIELLSESGNLPIYYPGDAEVYMKAGNLGNKIICAFINIGLDNLDDVTLVCEKEVKKISVMRYDGASEDVSFKKENGIITVDYPAAILDPVILLIE